MNHKETLREEKIKEIFRINDSEGLTFEEINTIKRAHEYASYVLQEEMEGLRKEIKELPEKLGVQPMQIGWWDEVLENVLSLIPRNENE